MTDAELIWIDEADALAIHDRLLMFHGGAAGLRDGGLLTSALTRPRQVASYGGTVDVITLATAYTYGLVKNHPFVDGNKRTSFVLGVLFLELNGYRFTAPEDEAAQAVIGLAAGTIDEAGYMAFLRGNVTTVTVSPPIPGEEREPQ